MKYFKHLLAVALVAGMFTAVAAPSNSSSLATSYQELGVKSIHLSAKLQARAAVGSRECVGYRIDKNNLWQNTWNFKDPAQGIFYVDDEVHTLSVKLVDNALYQYCPRGDLVGLVRVKRLNHCHLNGDPDQRSYRTEWFKGVKFNDFIRDDYLNQNPPEHMVEDDNNGGNCEYFYLSYSDDPWLRMDQDPFRTGTTWLVYNNLPDKNIDMMAGDGRRRYFHPTADDTVGDPY